MPIKQFASTVRVTAAASPEGKELIQLMVKNVNNIPKQAPLIQKIIDKMTPAQAKTMVKLWNQSIELRGSTKGVDFLMKFLGVADDPVFDTAPLPKLKRYEKFLSNFAGTVAHRIMHPQKPEADSPSGADLLIQPEEALNLATDAFKEMIQELIRAADVKFPKVWYPTLDDKRSFKDNGALLDLFSTADFQPKVGEEYTPEYTANMSKAYEDMADVLKKKGFSVALAKKPGARPPEDKAFSFTKKVKIGNADVNITGRVTVGGLSVSYEFKLK